MSKQLIALACVTVALLLLAGCRSTGPTVATLPATDPPIPIDTAPPPADTPAPEAEAQTWPTKRESHTMAYDPQSDRVLLFCGYDDFVSGLAWEHEDVQSRARDEWAYDVIQDRLELLATKPHVIYNQAVYDEQSQQLISFGPESTAAYNMESRDWEKTEPAEEPPLFRFWYALAYDSQSDRVILFGGYPKLQDTWAYDYDTNTWTEMSPEVSPPKRQQHAMAYDAESDRIILWGATEVGQTPMSEEEHATIWTYDYDANTWSAIESTGGPSYRGGHSMVYHPGTDRIILFGGYHLGDVNFSDETWAYDYNTNTWTQLSPAAHPSGRRLHTMVYAEDADKMVLFGGIAGTFLKEEINDDLWIFDPVAEEWSQVLPGTTNP
jgi:hypothetical protein